MRRLWQKINGAFVRICFPESAPPPARLETPSGRVLERHSSGKGSVMTYVYNGVEHRLFVADAVYRKQYVACRTFISSENPPGTAYVSVPLLTPRNPFSEADIAGWLRDNPSDYLDPKSSYENTEIYIQNSDSTGNVEYCRSLVIDGRGCDYPNFNDLFRVCIEAVGIDALDPTAKDNPKLSLALYNPGGYFAMGVDQFSGAVASTQNAGNSGYNMGMRVNGQVGLGHPIGNAYNTLIPVREL